MKYSTLISACLLSTYALADYSPPINGEVVSSLFPISDNSAKQEANSFVADVNHVNQNTGNMGIFDYLNFKNNKELDIDESAYNNEALHPFYSFYMSISMIVVSEIGDKSFVIAAILAMRNPRMVVFSAATSALVLMTLLSGLIGQLLPQLLSPTFTRAVASILFLIFGINLLREGINTDKNQGVEEEVAEVEEELASAEINELTSDLEKGEIRNKSVDWKIKMKNLISYISSPIWYQTFSMTFLGEWGDRSQITTIAMAAGGDWIMVVLGGCVGHALCTLMAVLAGHAISTRISMKTILLGGAVSFFIFSSLYGYAALYQ